MNPQFYLYHLQLGTSQSCGKIVKINVVLNLLSVRVMQNEFPVYN